jgi:hypothetical protein
MKQSQNVAARLEKVRSGISKLDLEPMVFKIMENDDGEGWPEHYVRKVEISYRRFLYLNATNPAFPVVPSKAVDTFWHYHILDTRKYEADCKIIFGRMFHHFPYFGMRGESDKLALDKAFDDTKRLYFDNFGDFSGFFDLDLDLVKTGCFDSNSSAGREHGGSRHSESEGVAAAVCGGSGCSGGPCGDRGVVGDLNQAHRPGKQYQPSSDWIGGSTSH